MPPKSKSHSSPGKRSAAPNSHETKETSTSSVTSELAYDSNKKTSCLRTWPDTQTAKTPSSPALIYTHGAASDLNAPAVRNFWSGFAPKAEILGFNGNMNLSSRVKMFRAVINNELLKLKKEGQLALGGRSMGARAAVMAAAEQEKAKRLVLVSYPLQAGSDVRDQILLDIEEGIEVLFIIGEKDHMCQIPRLNEVRRKMKATSWLVVVSGATHGMDVTPKRGTQGVGDMTGVIAADWLHERDSSKREGVLQWDNASEEAKWSGWSEHHPEVNDGIEQQPSEGTAKQPAKRKKVAKQPEESATKEAEIRGSERRATRSSKRQKRT